MINSDAKIIDLAHERAKRKPVDLFTLWFQFWLFWFGWIRS